MGDLLFGFGTEPRAPSQSNRCAELPRSETKAPTAMFGERASYRLTDCAIQMSRRRAGSFNSVVGCRTEWAVRVRSSSPAEKTDGRKWSNGVRVTVAGFGHVQRRARPAQMVAADQSFRKKSKLALLAKRASRGLRRNSDRCANTRRTTFAA
jgi:hypothetical protein